MAGFIPFKQALEIWKQRLGKNPPRYLNSACQREVEVIMGARPKNVCYGCGTQCPSSRRTWCGNSCIAYFLVVKGHSETIRKLVEKRDQGKCQSCGTNCLDLYSRIKKLPFDKIQKALPSLKGHFSQKLLASFQPTIEWIEMLLKAMRKSPYHIHHQLPVHSGGGCCSLSNLVLLCKRCHIQKHRKNN